MLSRRQNADEQRIAVLRLQWMRGEEGDGDGGDGEGNGDEGQGPGTGTGTGASL